ncbi:MAG: PadR family transcriptional regulator [Herbiconiux sp.]|uniref:PadR family transcriptional regulator n=1 Tax=Herbiconiux sp. TaxID=1871186 RepID=UPI0011FB0440|nr:PadR family transcriptional regulator [Herbiconiux sp.]TAJ50022.1 MAG: PadR family transcriptional regulator [Herbiconiux sp.]
MTPVFGHGHLRLYLLSLLDESPKHGYELIQALSDRFGGTYSPSAGTIYPRLAKLEEEGLVSKSSDGRKTVYAITDAGRAELEARRGELDDIEAQLSDSVRRLADEVRSGVNQAMKSLKADLASAARDARADAAWGAKAGSSGASGAGATSSATTTGATESGFSRSDSNTALRDADLVLTEFRQQMRLDLRKAAGRGLDPALVSKLQQRLGDVQAELRDDLARSRAGN